MDRRRGSVTLQQCTRSWLQSTWQDSCASGDGPTQNHTAAMTYGIHLHLYCAHRSHAHTHPFNGPLSGTTRVSRYEKGKTSLDFTEAGDSEWQWHQLGHMQKSAHRFRQITTPAPHHHNFDVARCPSCCPTNSVKALMTLIFNSFMKTAA